MTEVVLMRNLLQNDQNQIVNAQTATLEVDKSCWIIFVMLNFQQKTVITGKPSSHNFINQIRLGV